MGKASSTKKVARAASTGGGRTNRGRTPWLWYLSIALVIALGTAGIVQSRHQREVKLAAGTLTPPRLANSSKHQPADHWHMAYGVYLCDHFAANLPANPEKGGIHTHDDGLIHVEPVDVQDTGNHATVSRFVQLAGIKLNETTIGYPGEKTYKNGDKCPTKDGDKPGEVQARVNGKPVTGDPRNIKLKDGQNVTIAFVPKGADIPETPSVANLKDPNANEGQPAATPGAPGAPGAPGDTTPPAPGDTTPPAPGDTTPPTAPPPSGAPPSSTP
jgi:hypothetical protein